MRVLGIDPGYDRLGLAVIEKMPRGVEKIIFSTCLLTSRQLSFEERLYNLVEKIELIIKKQQPDLLALEKVFFTTNHKTAMAVAEVRGAIIYLAQKLKLPVINLTPLEVKSAIAGYGGANKEQIKQMVQKILNKKQIFKYDDEADALAIALTGLYRAPLVSPIGDGFIHSYRH
ncbi:MAG: crossover junction endodeoxyribonuclease RuvC [Patescibacteria group bacterium]